MINLPQTLFGNQVIFAILSKNWCTIGQKAETRKPNKPQAIHREEFIEPQAEKL